jgi:S-DNA-T family DNA segregation ATPase FtsK/SpoIIIE
LERRQRKFNSARDELGEGTIDIYKYQSLYREGKVKEPMSHLFIISDEFAELKQQQPDFMDELVSTARIGRSLGVHLILATQKPAGIVNDQIWSNSRFKICLKVQTVEDSMEVLRKDNASKIRETGRFYLQVGNDELFELGQSAWAGDKYYPTEYVFPKINDSLDFISTDGNIIKSVNDDIRQSGTNHGEQLPNIVQYLYDLAVSENIRFNSLWLPSIPRDLYLEMLINKYNERSAFLRAYISSKEDGTYLELHGTNIDSYDTESLCNTICFFINELFDDNTLPYLQEITKYTFQD